MDGGGNVDNDVVSERGVWKESATSLFDSLLGLLNACVHCQKTD